MLQSRNATAFLIIALITVSTTLGLVLAQDGSSVSTEVRINARQLDDGRVEFALQQRENGDWGARELAQRRYLPAEVGHNRWLSSSPYTVTIGLSEPEPAAEASEQANAEFEEWQWSGGRGGSESVRLDEGWWYIGIRATYTGRDAACSASFDSHERAPNGDRAFSVWVTAQRAGGTTRVFKVGPDGDASSGRYQATVGRCDYAGFTVRTATQEEIDDELVRRAK